MQHAYATCPCNVQCNMHVQQTRATRQLWFCNLDNIIYRVWSTTNSRICKSMIKANEARQKRKARQGTPTTCTYTRVSYESKLCIGMNYYYYYYYMWSGKMSTCTKPSHLHNHDTSIRTYCNSRDFDFDILCAFDRNACAHLQMQLAIMASNRKLMDQTTQRW